MEKYLKMLDFPKKRDKISRLLRNTQPSYCRTLIHIYFHKDVPTKQDHMSLSKNYQ